MKKFDSIRDGLAAMKLMTTAERRKVGALLTFQHTNRKLADLCFLFESVEPPQAQLIQNYPDSLGVLGLGHQAAQEAFAGRNTVISTLLSVFDSEVLDLKQHGHAEEFLIRDFDEALGQVKEVRNVTIYVSHSPCTIHDTKPSNSLHGWPASCTAKFNRLASSYPALQFTVCYWNPFGAYSGAANLENTLKTLSGTLPNLAFADVRRQ